MPQSLAFKMSFASWRRKFGERIVRVLIGVGCDRGQRFDLTNDVQPGLDAGAVGATPSLQSKGHLHGVEQRNVKDAYEPVVAGVSEVSERVQARDACRRRQPVDRESRLQLLQPWRGEFLRLNATQQRCQRIQVSMRF